MKIIGRWKALTSGRTGEKKKDGRVKEPKASCKDFLKTPFGKYFSHGHEQKGNILDVSLPCPATSCRFDGFSTMFDGYSDKLKNHLLISKNKQTAVTKLNFGLVERLGRIF